VEISPAEPSFFSCPAIFDSTLKKDGVKIATEMIELTAKVAQIESSKPALEALLKRVLELERKLLEDKK
jgi:hypothetical protein